LIRIPDCVRNILSQYERILEVIAEGNQSSAKRNQAGCGVIQDHNGEADSK
jgi:hypothetical protein